MLLIQMITIYLRTKVQSAFLMINLDLFTVKFDSLLQGATIERLYIYFFQYQ